MNTTARLVEEFYNGTAEKDWPAWATETVAILERMPALADALAAASNKILTGKAGLADANACMSAADALGTQGDVTPACSACGDTGDIHDLTGQYLGGCDGCDAWKRQRASGVDLPAEPNRDGARYRWLREHFDSIAAADLSGGWDVRIGALEETGDANRAAELDAAIDASMAADGVTVPAHQVNGGLAPMKDSPANQMDEPK